MADHRTPLLVFMFTLLLMLLFLVFPSIKFGQEWRIMKTWSVPWSWPIMFVIFVICLISNRFLFAGLYQLGRHYGFLGELEFHLFTVETFAQLALVKQIVDTLVESGILAGVIYFYKPLPGDLFRWVVMQPFNLQHGWLVWATIGFIATAVGFAATLGLCFAVDFFSGVGPAQIIMTHNSISDYLSSFLPPVTESTRVSLICMVLATSVLAPLIEEIMFRGLMMASISEWLSTPVAVMISAFLFSVSHLNPRLSPLIFVGGTVLGLSYAQTRNLLTPFVIHFLWNLSMLLITVYRDFRLRNRGLSILDSN